MFWNQKEVFMGCSLQRFNEVRYTLSENGIEHKYRVIDNNNPSFLGLSRRARTGTFGEKMDYSKTYYIYVHKSNYDKVCALLRK